MENKKKLTILEKKIVQLEELIREKLITDYYKNTLIKEIDINRIENIVRTRNKALIKIFLTKPYETLFVKIGGQT